MLRAYRERQFASLSEWNYRVFFFGQMVSQMGGWTQTVAQSWLVLQLTDSPLSLGLVTLLQTLPFTLFSLVGGVLADMLPKRKTLGIVQTVAMLQAFAMFFLAWSGAIEVWHIYVLAFVLGTTKATERPIRQSFYSELVGREKLGNAIALNSSLLNTARIVGPALGGVMIATIGVEGNFLVNGISFLAVLLAYGLMRPSEYYPARASKPGKNLLREVAGGVRYAWTTPKLAFLLILVAFIGTFGYNFNVITPLVAQYVLEVGPGKFGLLSSFLGAGALLSALSIAAVRQHDARLLYVTGGAFVAMLLLVSVSPLYWLSAAIFLGLGIAGTATMTTANTMLQLSADEEMRGRVISNYILLQSGTTPIGSMVIAFTSSHFGVQNALVLMAALCVAGLSLSFAYWRLRVARSGFPIASTRGADAVVGQ
ncbi:MAG TPA: MFS transporter [Tepidiformaceae bacterium]|nr:MFS transporter [Tepidiformaceae bacterium]